MSDLIKLEDLKIEYTESIRRKQGGQQVTLTSSGVRLTHIPTGIVAEVDVGRSQFDNREIALSMIESALTHPRFR